MEGGKEAVVHKLQRKSISVSVVEHEVLEVHIWNEYTCGEDGEFQGGGAGVGPADQHSSDLPEIERGLWVQILPDTYWDEEEDELVDSGRIQLNIGGERKAMELLAIKLLALSRYYAPKPWDKFEHFHLDLHTADGDPGIHLIFRVPVPVDEEGVRLPFLT